MNYIELLRDVHLGGYELPSINVISTTVHFPQPVPVSVAMDTNSVRLFLSLSKILVRPSLEPLRYFSNQRIWGG